MPQLFAKYQTDHVRMAELVRLPQFMKLDLYLEMRMISVRPFFSISTSNMILNPNLSSI